MPPVPVAKDPDVIPDFTYCLDPCPVVLMVNELCFERSEESFPQVRYIGSCPCGCLEIFSNATSGGSQLTTFGTHISLLDSIYTTYAL